MKISFLSLLPLSSGAIVAVLILPVKTSYLRLLLTVTEKRVHVKSAESLILM